jgi:hypothetical protein
LKSFKVASLLGLLAGLACVDSTPPHPLDSGVVDPPSDGGATGGDAGTVGDAGPTGISRQWWDVEINDPADTPDFILGDGHVHSDFSGDGHNPALEMMNRALSLGADFVWITDHARTPTQLGGVTAAEFDVCSAKGRQATNAVQFAGCGVELRLGYTRPNGSKVYEAWHQILHGVEEAQFGEVLSEFGYTDWKTYQDDLARMPNAYASITHPSGPTPWYNDDDSEYRDTHPENHPNVELIELNGGDDNPANGGNLVDGINAYFRFLSDDWQVSPVWDSDMHYFFSGEEKAQGNGAWIKLSDWTPDRFRSALRTSARKHNTFANHPGDERNFIQLVTLAAPGGSAEAMMGSTLLPRAQLHLRARAKISNSVKRWTFKLFTNKHDRFENPQLSAGEAKTEVVLGGKAQEWAFSLDTTGIRWVVVYASPDPGDPGKATQYLVSAPIWIKR